MIYGICSHAHYQHHSVFLFHSLPQKVGYIHLLGQIRWSCLVKSSVQWLSSSPEAAEAAHYQQHQLSDFNNNLLSSFIGHSLDKTQLIHSGEDDADDEDYEDGYQWWKQSSAWDIKTCVKRPPEMGSNRVNTTLHHWLTPQIHPLLWDGL